MESIEEALELVETLVLGKTGNYPSEVQRAILRGAWEGKEKTYDRIAHDCGYSASYIKQGVAPKLWKLLSEALEQKISKANFRYAIGRQVRREKLIRALKQKLGQDSQEPISLASDREKLLRWAGPVNEEISSYLDKIAPRIWQDPAPAPILSAEIVQEKEIAAKPPTNSSLLARDWVKLEFPEGRVSRQSNFYVERGPQEKRCYDEINKPGAFIRIKAPNQLGKSSLMVRILDRAKSRGYSTVGLNFNRADESILSDLDKFLRWFCLMVGRLLKLKPMLDDYWDPDLGSKISCTAYFQEYLLQKIDRPLVLALDEVNRIFNEPNLASDFALLLRSWHEESKDTEIWQKLHFVVVYSPELYITSNLYESPFDVGLLIELPPFAPAQVQDLARRHGLNLSAAERDRLMQLLGGHPYLVRLALYQIALQKVSVAHLAEAAPTETGLYRDYLHRYLCNLKQQPDLAAAFEKVVSSREPVELEPLLALKLQGMGLVNWQGRKVTPSCDLYRRYFSNRLPR